MALNSFTLQTTNIPGGRITAILYTDLSDLIVPTFHSLLIDGEETETVDIVPGEIQVPEMMFHVLEDYTNYANGFWHKVIFESETVEIRLQLFDGVESSEPFWGTLKPGTTDLTEFDLSVRPQRTGEFVCYSKLADLKIASTTDLMAEIVANHVVTGSLADETPIKVWPCYITISSMLYIAGLNASQDVSDVVFDDTDELDVQFGYDSVWYNFSEMYYVYSTYIDSAWVMGNLPAQWGIDPDNFEPAYQNCWDLLNRLSMDWGFIPKLFYDADASRWRIRLSTPGRVNSAALLTSVGVLSQPMESNYFPQDDSLFTGIIINPPTGSSVTGVWWYRGQNNLLLTMPVPADMEASKTIDYHFDVNVSSTPHSQCVYVDISGELNMRTGPGLYARMWDYADGDWSFDNDNTIVNARMGYELTRFLGAWWTTEVFGPLRRGYSRIYAGTGATVSGTYKDANLGLLSCIAINDGVDTRTYLAKEISKNRFKNETRIRWIEL